MEFVLRIYQTTFYRVELNGLLVAAQQLILDPLKLSPIMFSRVVLVSDSESDKRMLPYCGCEPEDHIPGVFVKFVRLRRRRTLVQ